jgi:hypothetical protein
MGGVTLWHLNRFLQCMYQIHHTWIYLLNHSPSPPTSDSWNSFNWYHFFKKLIYLYNKKNKCLFFRPYIQEHSIYFNLFKYFWHLSVEFCFICMLHTFFLFFYHFCIYLHMYTFFAQYSPSFLIFSCTHLHNWGSIHYSPVWSHLQLEWYWPKHHKCTRHIFV